MTVQIHFAAATPSAYANAVKNFWDEPWKSAFIITLLVYVPHNQFKPMNRRFVADDEWKAWVPLPILSLCTQYKSSTNARPGRAKWEARFVVHESKRLPLDVVFANLFVKDRSSQRCSILCRHNLHQMTQRSVINCNQLGLTCVPSTPTSAECNTCAPIWLRVVAW